MDINDDIPSPKRPVKKPRVSATGPSADRINTQNIISSTPGTPKPILSPEQDRGRKRFFRKDPWKVKPAHRQSNILNLKLEQTENQEDQPLPQPPIVPNDENNNTKKKSDEHVKPKGVFNTTKHGLVKHKTVRYFKCPICGIHKTMVLKLNDHFKRRHPPLKCDKCDSSFHTLSSLARQSYTHLEPRFKCKDCDKQCYFEGELKQHYTVHLKT